MYKKSILKVIVAIAVAMFFVMPVAAFANVEAIGVTSNSKNIGDMEIMVESVDSDTNMDTMVATTDFDDVSDGDMDLLLTTQNTIYVDDDADPSWYDETHVRTIQEGVDNATAGYTVYVYNGTYYELVTVNKQLDLVGESREGVIVDGSGTGYVFYVLAINGVSIDTFTITNGKRGINNEQSDYTTITNCTIYGNSEYGIRLYRSAYCTLTGNAMYDNKVNFEVKGSFMEPGDVTHFTHYIDPTNTVNGKPMYYILDEHDKVYDGSLNFGFLALISCDNVTAKDADVEGVIMINTIDSLISNITSHGAANGIFLAFSYQNDIEGCTLYDNDYGMTVDDSSYYTHVKNCVAYNNSKDGFYNREFSDHNIIENCVAYNNGQHGIDIYDSEHVSVINCTSYNNSQHGFKARYDIIDITFDDCTAYDNKQDGFYIDGFSQGPSGENRFTNCTSYNNVEDGFLMRFCSRSDVTNCAFYDNGECNFVIDGNSLSHFAHNIDPSNTIDGKPIYYLTGESSIELNETHNMGYLGLISCTNITVKNSDVQGMVIVNTIKSTISNVTSHTSKVGITLLGSSYNTLTDCNTYGCVYDFGGNHGIKVSGSRYNTFERCTSNGNRGGIHFYDSPNNNILNCTSCDSQGASDDGIWLQYSDNCNIEGCDTYNNAYGIRIYSSCNGGRIVNNSVHHNTRYGIYIGTGSSNHLIHHNIFANNDQNARDLSSNQWDNGYPSGGNYWDDYIGVDEYSGPSQNIPGSDGIGDTPYIVPDGLNQDNYPLMSPVDETPPIITDVQATPYLQKYPTEPVNITCTVIDNIAVDTVKVRVDGPEGFILEEEMNEGSYWYEDTYEIVGIYYYYIWANDTSGNIAISDTYSFVIHDGDMPMSAVDPLPAWGNIVPFTVTATAYDNTRVVSVTLWYRYSENGTEWTDWISYGIDEEAPWSWSFTGNDGYYGFYSIAVDDIGNVEDPPDVADASTGIDTIPPHTEINLSGTMGENGWYVSCVIVTLVATDEGSGVESTWYRVDGVGNWKFYHKSFEVCEEGYHIVEAYSFDYAGNKEVLKIAEFKIDAKPPVTTHSFDGMIGNDGWFVSDVRVTLSAEDQSSGVNYTKYRLDDGTWMNYTEPFDVTENGEYTLCYYSVDLAGHREDTNDATFKIEKDLIPPVTTHEFGGIIGDNDWFTSDVRVTLTAEDDSSGVESTYYKLEDDTEWQEYTGLILVTEDGEHNITYFSVDKVGNNESVKGSFDFKIDQTVPTINLAAEKIGTNTWLLTADVFDETSGVAKVEFYVAGEYLGEVTESPYTWEVINPKKDDKAQAIVYDNAGNLKISKEVDSQSQGQDAFIGWTFLLGMITNMEESENIITAQATWLRYIEIAPTGITVGFVKMTVVEFSSHTFLGRRISRSFGQMSLVFGVFKGGITIENE